MSDQHLLPAAEPASLEAWLAAFRRCEREGGLFRAYDLAMRGLERFPGEAALGHRAVLCLARSGAIRQAVAQFDKLLAGGSAGAASPRLALDIAALGARLLKDEALAAGGSDLDALATTIRQLRLLLAARGLAADWLDELMPPRVVHYLGHIVAPPGASGRFPAEQEAAIAAAIAEKLAAAKAGFGFGSLAAGADILFAEALLARGASLEVVLPFDRDEFVEISVRPAGASWVERFHACLERARTLHCATEDRYLGDDSLFAYCSRLAMGLALLRARHLETGVEQIAVWDGDPAGPVGTAADMAVWRRTGLPQTTIAVAGGPAAAPNPRPARPVERRIRAMLFSDAHGFSKLRDDQLPRFIDTILGCCARTLARFRNNTCFANTWGDGLFVVFDEAGAAARCALALQEALAGIDKAAAGLPSDLGCASAAIWGRSMPPATRFSGARTSSARMSAAPRASSR
jgi:hypothetical protein